MFTGIAFSETIVKPESALRVRGDCSRGSSLYSMLRLRAAVLQVWFRTANTNKHENFNHDSEAGAGQQISKCFGIQATYFKATCMGSQRALWF